jgi:membrane protein YqaA with SNARE-associated domain
MIDIFFKIVYIFSYFGFFLIGFISTSTIFLPFPIYIFTVITEKFGFNPLLVALSTSLGMSFGELTGYFTGYIGYKLSRKKIEKNKFYRKFKNWFKKFGDLTIFLFAFLPLPFDVVGISCGLSKYDLKKFLLFTFLGKFLKMLLLLYSFELFESFFFL